LLNANETSAAISRSISGSESSTAAALASAAARLSDAV
jgi:hypothetical protein